jgi:hypothetical protein
LSEPKLRFPDTKIRIKKPKIGLKWPNFGLFRAKDGVFGLVALFYAAFVRFFERGVGLKGIVDDFVPAACRF